MGTGHEEHEVVLCMCVEERKKFTPNSGSHTRNNQT